MILIPVKNLSAAKQRLAAVLDQPARTELAQSMLHDVVTVLAGWSRRPACALVTSDPFALDLARQYDFEIIPDPANPGETGAIEMATQVCVERGIDNTLVIPADIPLIHATELEQIYAVAPDEGSVLAPAADGRGTNAIFAAPPICFRFASVTTASNRISPRREQLENLVASYNCQASLLTWTIPKTCNGFFRIREKLALRASFAAGWSRAACLSVRRRSDERTTTPAT